MQPNIITKHPLWLYQNILFVESGQRDEMVDKEIGQIVIFFDQIDSTLGHRLLWVNLVKDYMSKNICKDLYKLPALCKIGLTRQ
jgi:hypothetical protein